jgi:transposase
LSDEIPEAYLREVLARIGDHPINRIQGLLLWNFAADQDLATRS